MELNVHYKRQMDRNYMVIDGNDDILEPHYEMRMLKENEIQGLMKVSILPVDCHLEYCYDISSLQPLSRFYQKKKIELKEVQTLFFSLKREMELMEPYLMEACHLILEPEYIYIRPQTFQVYFCYHTEVVSDFQQSVRQLIQFVLEKLNHDDKDGIVAVYQMYQRSLEESITVEELLKTVFTTYEIEEEESDMKEDNLDVEVIESESNAIFIPSTTNVVTLWEAQNRKKHITVLFVSIMILVIMICVVLLNELWKQTEVFVVLLGITAMGILYNIWNFQQMKGKEVFLSNQNNYESSDRICDGSDSEHSKEISKEHLQNEIPLGSTGPLENKENHALISDNPGVWEHIQMNQYPYVIGRMAENCNVVLNFQEISRLHAEIQKKEDEMWIMDLNSSNGTYVNDMRLEANTPTLIKTGDKIRFAKISYTFY